MVALVASAGSLAAGWGVATAVELAHAWGAAGARLVLADGGLGDPLLADALGVRPGEGLVDALRWGASVQRVTRRPEGRPFFVITAGTPVADTAAVFATPRWAALCGGFREAGVTLAVLVGASDPSLAGVLGQATHAVVVATREEARDALLPAFPGEILAVVGREAAPAAASPTVLPDDDLPAVPEPEATSGAPSPEPAGEPFEPLAEVEVQSWQADVGSAPEVDAGPDPLEAEAWPDAAPGSVFEPEPESAGTPETDAAPAAPGSLEAEGPSAAGDPPAGAPPAEEATGAAEGGGTEAKEAWSDPLAFPRREEGPPAPLPPFRLAGVPTLEEIVEESDAGPPLARHGRGRSWFVAGALLILAVLVALAAWLGWLPVPGVPTRGAEDVAPPVGGAVGPSMAAGPAEPVAPPAPFSLALAAFQDAAAARALVDEVESALPGSLVLAVPVDVQGRLLHRVLVGALADSTDALEMAGRLAAALGADPAEWVPRRTAGAFQLGEVLDRSAARRRAQVLADLEIPAYVLAVPYSDGSVRYRVYAGAFADEAEASRLSALLVERGLSGATFSDRIGHLPE